MPTVTVSGANGQIVSLAFDTNANAALAQRLAAAISAGVQGGTIQAASDTGGPPPPLLPGQTGEFVQTLPGTTILPPGYKAVVNDASEAIIFGSGDADESVLSGAGKLDFFAKGGSGTVVAGAGDNRIVIPGNDPGNWSLNTGNGNDQIFALGSGSDTISAGGGKNAIDLGNGDNIVLTTGDDTVNAGSGNETVTAIGPSSDMIFGNASRLFFVGADGSATVLGGSGSDTFFGGTGPDFVRGGTAGNNFLVAGSGAATLFGGGNGDQLFATGDKAQALHAGAGNETLFGGFASGADSFYGSSGTTAITGGSGNDTFVFTNGQAGGTASIQGFLSGQDLIDLQGYAKNEVAQALKSQTVANGADTITLSDNTTITFAGVSSLSAADFITSGGTVGGGVGGIGDGDDDGDDNMHGHGDDGGHGHHGRDGSSSGDDQSHLRDAMFKHD